PFAGEKGQTVKVFQPIVKIEFLRPYSMFTESEKKKFDFILQSNNTMLKTEGIYSLNPDAGYQVIEVANQFNQLEFVRFAYPLTETIERTH
ncbi:MAG: hypothetical protein ACRC3B_20965, partial [Bacteroidia bacterium]